MNVLNALKNIPRDEYIFNVGYAGSNNIEKGKKVAVSSVNTLHEKVEFNEMPRYCLAPVKCDEIALCYTTTDFVTKTDIKENCVFDMELAFICSLFDNVMAIKVVSDNLSHEEYK